MKSFLFTAAALLAAASAHGATLTTTNMAGSPGFYAVAPEQTYFDYDHRFASLNEAGAATVDVQTQTFWTDADQFWLFDANDVGALHTIDLTPLPSLVNLTMHEIDNGQQRVSYRYFYGQTTGGVTVEQWLPVVNRTVAGVPEPAAALLGLAAAAGLALIRRVY
jgi:hypothetical protein